MIFLFYIPKVQALDKAIGIHLELAAKFPEAGFAYVFAIEDKNQIKSCSLLFEMIANENATVIALSNSGLLEEIKQIWSRDEEGVIEVCVEQNSLTAVAKKVVEALFDGGDKNATQNIVLLLPKTTEAHGFGNYLKAQIQSEPNGAVFAYFKSVHDAGYGLTTVSKTPARWSLRRTLVSIKKRLKPARFVPKKGKAGSSFTDDHIDGFLCFNDQQYELLKNGSGDASKLHVIGYPILFPQWQTKIRKLASKQTTHDDEKIVTIFSRGETPGRPSSENIITNSMLGEMLNDIVDAFLLREERCRFIVKPHPIQDIAVLDEILERLGSKAKIGVSYDPPSLLAAISDYAVSTYSSTVIDTLAFEVPTIEYLQENMFFKRKHPLGSPFPRLGVIRVNSRHELFTVLNDITSQPFEKAMLAEKLGHRVDLSVFNFCSPS
jgi:hypothetical protein